MIAIVNYGMGNLKSVARAFEALHADVRITSEAADLRRADRIVLPGVGAFGEGMRNIERIGLRGALETEVLEKRKPFLGICLGMELLARESLEHGRHAGLGWVPAVVRPFNLARGSLKATHIGWNDVSVVQPEPLFARMGPSTDFYFVHQYFVDCEEPAFVAGTSEYGVTFPAALRKDNVLAVQFHPEKSQEAGLALLRNFLAWDGCAC